MSNPIKIYLEPYCPDCLGKEPEYFGYEGRQWCEDSDVWEYECDLCGKELDLFEYKRTEEK